MKMLRVLHVASFTGNIGDNINHMGFRPWFALQCETAIDWVELEIREFYWGERQWDERFVNYANEFDLVVVGGGNYFELWVESSPTGTSIAIPPELFKKISTPILFNALGVDPGQGTTPDTVDRFRVFLERLTHSSQFLVSVRNDGAMQNLATHVGEDCTKRVHMVPDGGFFVGCVDPKDMKNGSDTCRPKIAINIACDMPEIRFQAFGGPSGVPHFADQFAELVSRIADQYCEHDLVFIPHVHHDLKIISEIISRLGDRLRRTRTTVASYGTGIKAAYQSLQSYCASELVLAMRFHANVCGITQRRQTLGLCNYPQIQSLYTELEQTDRIVDVSGSEFVEEAETKVVQALTSPDRFQGNCLSALKLVEEQRKRFEPELRAWLRANNCGVRN